MFYIRDDFHHYKTKYTYSSFYLKRLRKKHQLSGEELAYRSGVSHSQITRIESGKQNATVLTMISICKGLNITLHDFFSDFEYPIIKKKK